MDRTEQSISDIIRERRTIRDFNGEPVEKQTVLDILNTAVWAPFHSRKEPWRFILFMGDGRKKFAEAVIRSYSEEVRRDWADWARDQYGRLIQAQLIVVAKAGPRDKFREDALYATAALVQNVQLAAWEQGIGTVWKTNECNWDPDFKRETGVEQDEEIVGIVLMGRFDKKPRAFASSPAEKLLVFVDE